jgi:hypothetical protein
MPRIVTREALDLKLRAFGVGDRVRERILRLNPSVDEGTRLRGCFNRYRKTNRLIAGEMTRGEFIKAHGAEAWAHLPASAFVKDGKRRIVRAGWDTASDIAGRFT